jgi:hypothetical protein
LPDPRLNGNFPEEEMQIMAYLAKECLLLDPDDRPTMSEVVQILSTITPEKSRRRNLPVYLYQVNTFLPLYARYFTLLAQVIFLSYLILYPLLLIIIGPQWEDHCTLFCCPLVCCCSDLAPVGRGLAH